MGACSLLSRRRIFRRLPRSQSFWRRERKIARHWLRRSAARAVAVWLTARCFRRGSRINLMIEKSNLFPTIFVALFLIAGISVLTGCSYPWRHSGWTCHSVDGEQKCAPDNGNWRGLKLGMTYPQAISSLCTILRTGAIGPDDPQYLMKGYNPIYEDCSEKSWAEPNYMLSTRSRVDWQLHATDMWCFGLLTDGIDGKFHERQLVYVTFDNKSFRVKSIDARCPQQAF
jgi:hypothetical protein